MANITFVQEDIICQTKEVVRYPIPKEDWNNLKKLVGKIIPPKKIFHDLTLMFFTFCFSSFLALIACRNTEKVVVWIITTLWAVLIGSFLLGVGFAIIGHNQKKLVNYSIDYVISEMNYIESKYILPNSKDSE